MYDQANLVAYAFTIIEKLIYLEHRNYKEALDSKDDDKWVLEMNEEIESLYKNNIWVWVNKPDKAKLIGFKWILKKNDRIPGVENLQS